MNNEHGPVILCAPLLNMSTEWIDTKIVDKALTHAIEMDGKATCEAPPANVRIVIPDPEHGRFLSETEKDSLRYIQDSGCDMVLTGSVKTSIFKKNLAPIRFYYVDVEVRDARYLTKVIWHGHDESLTKGVRAGPVRKAFYKNNW
jgi:hypothetical protein